MLKILGINLTIQLSESSSESKEGGHISEMQLHALQRLRTEVEEYERYMDTITYCMDEETINAMRDNELVSNYVVNITVENKKKSDRSTMNPRTVRWLFQTGRDGHVTSTPGHLPIWYVLQAHYVECICLRAHLRSIKDNNGSVTFTGLDKFDSMDQRLSFVRTHLASVVELVSFLLVAHWTHLRNVVENITFEVCHKKEKNQIWIENGSKTLHLRIPSSAESLPDIDEFFSERVREQIAISEQMKETMTYLRKKTQQFAKALCGELGGNLAVGTIQEDDIIAGLSKESLRYLCPPNAILATSVIHLPDMHKSVSRACFVLSANQPSTSIWKWHTSVGTDNTSDKLTRLRLWIASEGFTDTQSRDRLLLTKDHRGNIMMHVNPNESVAGDKHVLGRWESFSMGEIVGDKSRLTAQRVDFLSYEGVMYRTTGGVEEFVKHLPNVVNVGWKVNSNSPAEVDVTRGVITVYASNCVRDPPLVNSPVWQRKYKKHLQLEAAPHLLLQKLNDVERHLSRPFCKVNVDWTSWSRFAKEDGLARLAMFTLLTTLDRLEAAVDNAFRQLQYSANKSVEESPGNTGPKSLNVFQNVTVHFDYDLSTPEKSVKQVINASPWMLVILDTRLIVSCKKLIFDDEGEVRDVKYQSKRYADISTNEECPLWTALHAHVDALTTDHKTQLRKNVIHRTFDEFQNEWAKRNVSLAVIATVPSLNTSKGFEQLHHPDLPDDVMARYVSKMEDSVEPFFRALAYLAASRVREKLRNVVGVEVVLPHADDTSRIYGITFQNGVLQYTLTASPDHTKTHSPSRIMLVNAILRALKCKPKWSDETKGRPSAEETSISESYRHGLQLPLLGSENVFCLELRNAVGDLVTQAELVKGGDITISVLRDSKTVRCESHVQEQMKGEVRVAWTPPDPHSTDGGGYLVDVRWRGDPVKGSPFPAAAIRPNANRHRALGRGRLVRQADGCIQAGATWHQIVYHRPHGCTTLGELGQYVRKKETEQHGSRMTNETYLKTFQWRDLRRKGWQVKRHAALHVYYRQTGLEVTQSTSSQTRIGSARQSRPKTSRPRPVISTQRLVSARLRPMSSKQRPRPGSTSPRERPKTSRPRPMTSRPRPMTSRPRQMTISLEPTSPEPQPLISHAIPTFSVTELMGGHFLLRCRMFQVGIFETRVQCPVCNERLRSVSTTHSALQAARVIVMPGRISCDTSYLEGKCYKIVKFAIHHLKEEHSHELSLM